MVAAVTSPASTSMRGYPALVCGIRAISENGMTLPLSLSWTEETAKMEADRLPD